MSDETTKASLSGLVESLRADIYKDAFDDQVSVRDFDQLVSFASRGKE